MKSFPIDKGGFNMGLFKPGWESKNVDTRLKAVKKLDGYLNRDILKNIALNDPEKTVRLEALKKVKDIHFSNAKILVPAFCF